MLLMSKKKYNKLAQNLLFWLAIRRVFFSSSVALISLHRLDEVSISFFCCFLIFCLMMLMFHLAPFSKRMMVFVVVFRTGIYCQKHRIIHWIKIAFISCSNVNADFDAVDCCCCYINPYHRRNKNIYTSISSEVKSNKILLQTVLISTSLKVHT